MSSYFPPGLTCIQQEGDGGQKCVCVLQLTEVGDIFYQVLELQPPEDSVQPAERSRSSVGWAEALITDTSSDEDVVGPTQERNTCRLVPETPEREQQNDPDSPHESGSEPDQSTAERGSAERKEEANISGDTVTRWRHWLLKLYQLSSAVKAPKLTFVYMGKPTAPCHQGLAAAEQDQDQNQDLNQPLLDALDTDAWSDKLSRRLTATWQGGGEAWEAWWSLELGLDRSQKAEALLRRRRRDKAARRASGRHKQLPSSFASSATEISDWSSHGAWSDGEGPAPTHTPTPCTSSVQGPNEPAASLPPTPSKRWADRKVMDYLNSLSSQQVGSQSTADRFRFYFRQDISKHCGWDV